MGKGDIVLLLGYQLGHSGLSKKWVPESLILGFGSWAAFLDPPWARGELTSLKVET